MYRPNPKCIELSKYSKTLLVVFFRHKNRHNNACGVVVVAMTGFVVGALKYAH